MAGRKEPLILAGDVGATKTDLAVVSPGDGPGNPLASKTVRTADFGGVEALLLKFLAEVKLPVEAVILGVAGPVIEGRSKITNLPWVMDESRIAEALGLETVKLLNDIEAVAHAVPLLGEGDLETLNAGTPQRHGNKAVIAPGTGLGEAFLCWDGRHYRPGASEGGHADFAPGNDLETELLGYLRGRHDHVSYERVCSGMGIPLIYSFLLERGYGKEPPGLQERRCSAPDPTPVIIDAAMSKDGPCELAVMTLNIFTSVLGAEAGNLALKVLATGGVYIAGGIPPRILPYLTGGVLMERFLRKGRMSYLVSRMPVHVVINPRCALLGAACYGLQIMTEEISL